MEGRKKGNDGRSEEGKKDRRNGGTAKTKKDRTTHLYNYIASRMMHVLTVVK